MLNGFQPISVRIVYWIFYTFSPNIALKFEPISSREIEQLSPFHFFFPGELLCTRIRCRSANYNYTDYRLASNDNTQNVTEGHVHDGHVRGKDPCLECDYEPISLVCGPNWKTYRSMCHAMQCAGLKLEHVKEGDCEIMVSIKRIDQTFSWSALL